jgi:flagellar hook-associated protein 1 FlgK
MNSSLLTALSAATSGLRASQGSIDVISRNIANANTEGYTRKAATPQNAAGGVSGAGVNLAQPTRSVDQYLFKSILTESARNEALDVFDTYLAQLQTVFGTPADNTTVASKLNALQSAFDSLSVNPTDETQQRLVLAQADQLCQSLRQLTTSVQAMRTQADAEIAAAVTQVNADLAKIDQLNQSIGTLRNSGQSTADLEDQRDLLIVNVNRQLGISFFERDPQSGQYGIMTEGGRFLVDAGPIQLNFFTPTNTVPITPPITAPGTAPPIVSGTPIITAVHEYLPPDGTTAYSAGKAANLGSVYASVGGQFVDIKSEISTGRIAALFDLRDNVLPQAQAQLDQIAAAIAIGFQNSDQFNATGTDVVAGTEIELFQDSAGPPSYTPTVTYAGTAAAEVGLAGRIAVNSVFANDPSNGGQASYWRVVHGTNTAVVPTRPALDGDTTTLQRIQQLFENPNPPGTYPSTPPFNPPYQNKMFPDFTVYGLPAQNTLEGAAASFVSFQAEQKANNNDAFATQSALTSTLVNRRASDSGVSTDDELALMIQMQNSYGAAARVITTLSRMFDELLGLVR